MSGGTEGRPDADDADVQREILTHLAEHPHQDSTWEGILEWWLMERALERETRRVERALAALVEAGWLRLHGEGGRVRYAIPPERETEVRLLLASGVTRGLR